jgi:hypothetical protein
MNYLTSPAIEKFKLDFANKTKTSIKYLNSFSHNEEVTLIFVNKYMYSKAINNFENEINKYKNKNIIIYVFYYDKIEKLTGPFNVNDDTLKYFNYVFDSERSYYTEITENDIKKFIEKDNQLINKPFYIYN